MVIEEEWFSDMNLTDGATFPTALIKREKSIFNFENPCDTKQRILIILINNGCNT